MKQVTGWNNEVKPQSGAEYAQLQTPPALPPGVGSQGGTCSGWNV